MSPRQLCEWNVGVCIETLLDGFRRNGLVPTHQVGNFLEFSKEDTDEEKVAGMEGVVSRGETVWVKVVELKAGVRFFVACLLHIRLLKFRRSDELIKVQVEGNTRAVYSQ